MDPPITFCLVVRGVVFDACDGLEDLVEALPPSEMLCPQPPHRTEPTTTAPLENGNDWRWAPQFGHVIYKLPAF